MICGIAPEAGRTGKGTLLYSLPRSSLQGANPWVVIEELAAVTSSDRLRLVADGVGIEPTRPLRTRQPGGLPRSVNPARYRSATRPVSLSISPPGQAGAGFSASVLIYPHFCDRTSRKLRVVTKLCADG